MLDAVKNCTAMHCLLHWLGMTAYPWRDHQRCVMRDCKRARGQHCQTRYLRRRTPLRCGWWWALTCGLHWPKPAAGRWEV